MPSLCFGASGAAIHGFNEYVDLESLRKSTGDRAVHRGMVRGGEDLEKADGLSTSSRVFQFDSSIGWVDTHQA